MIEDETGMKTAAQWTRLPDSPPPVVGLEFEAEGFYPMNENAPEGALPTLKGVNVKAGQPMAQATSSEPRVGYQTNPVDAARMGRSAALKTATDFVVGMANAGAAPGTEMFAKCLEATVQVASRFEGEVADAGTNAQASKEASEPQVPEPVAAPPKEADPEEVPF